jgi:hypothetical protein
LKRKPNPGIDKLKFYAKKTIPLFIAILAVCLLSAGAALCAAETPVVYTSLPWLSGMARFIVGATMKVQSSSSWSSSGELRVPRKPPKNATVIALDPLDASRLGLSREADGLHLLYDNLPIENSARGSLHFNPSVLPFLSQRMLKVLCELSPDNYSFYQRRLAEFQSRLESAVEVGRSQIRDIPILDLTGAVSPWLKAASGKVARPPDELWNAWAQSTRTSDLAIAVKEAETRGWLILTDVWTPSQIKSRVASSGKRLAISPPAADYDFFAYLHDIYLQIWTLNSEK